MALPSHHTRRFVVDGAPFLLHSNQSAEGDFLPATVSAPECHSYLRIFLGIGMWPSGQLAASAIRWALQNGWTPATGPNREMVCRQDDAFEWRQPGDTKMWM